MRTASVRAMAPWPQAERWNVPRRGTAEPWTSFPISGNVLPDLILPVFLTPAARSETDFDPGAKFHVPGNTPYMRYFLADVLQFQFHRALCQTAGQKGPLHRCSIYGSEAAGEKLGAMMEMGSSKPWPEAMAALTGERAMDASAILDYFAPLQTWLDQAEPGPGLRLVVCRP